MEINLQVRFSTDLYAWLCFKHAVEEANKGIKVEVEVGDFSSEYYMGPTECVKCTGR